MLNQFVVQLSNFFIDSVKLLGVVTFLACKDPEVFMKLVVLLLDEIGDQHCGEKRSYCLVVQS